MVMSLNLTLDGASQQLKLDTLVRLRWMAVAGQTIAVAVVGLGLGYAFPFLACALLIVVSAVLNLFLKLRFPTSQRLKANAAAALLAYDILQLAGLLFLTGGLANPFAILLIAPVLVSATSLPVGTTVVLGFLVTFLASGLAFYAYPLPWAAGEELRLPDLYIVGIWIALVSALGFMAAYAFRVAQEARQLQAALSATELILSREQHLHQLDGLAAAAAHELGTPLATIALVAGELERETPVSAPHHEDIALLRSQSDRCREILSRLTSLSTNFAGPLAELPLSHLIEEVIAPHRHFGIKIVTRLQGPPETEPIGNRSPAILHGLGNLIENAVDFAKSAVEVTAQWDEARVAVIIADDGPGIAPEIIDRLGDPYVTTRPSSSSKTVEAGGLGLGFFIAKTLLERTGAQVMIARRSSPSEQGASITVSWPRTAMEKPA